MTNKSVIPAMVGLAVQSLTSLVNTTEVTELASTIAVAIMAAISLFEGAKAAYKAIKNFLANLKARSKNDTQ